VTEDVKFTYGLLREKFITRDNNAIQDYMRNSAYMPIEQKLQFVSDRCEDICGVVMKLLEELEKERNGVQN